MSFDLLYKTREENAPLCCAAELMLERTVAFFCPDIDAQKSALERLSNPPRLPENIRYRQELYKDLINNRQLLDELKNLCGINDSLLAEWRGARRQNTAIRANTNFRRDGSTGIEENTSVLVLELNAVYCQKALSLHKAVFEALCGYNVESEALRILTETLKKEVESQEYTELYNTTDIIKSMTSAGEAELCVTFDERLRICTARLSKIGTYCRATPALPLLSKRERVTDDRIPIEKNIRTVREVSVLLHEAADGAAEILEEITKVLCGEFSGFSDALLF